MTQTSYVVLDRSGNVIADDCDLELAAITVLTEDGYDYAIRPSADRDGNPREGFDLWHSDGSENSTRGARHMVKTVIFSLEIDEAAATADIYRQVIEHADWFRADVMTTEAYEAMLADADA